jgi:hypothetical protein
LIEKIFKDTERKQFMDALKKVPASVKMSRTAAQSALPRSMFSLEDVRGFVQELEVPFPSSVIEWRVMNISDDGTRGQIAPYTDPRAYTDRLNEIFTTAGWTRRYTVTTSANFERSEDKKLVAKVFVTCDLTIHGIGSHSATGEEWADNDNAGTSAEAQAFKRACSCFGLGRYLYSVTGIWVDLDEKQRPKEIPELFAWATPEGWRQGLRPPEREATASGKIGTNATRNRTTSRSRRPVPAATAKLIAQIEAMAEPLGRRLYRGLLKGTARVWKPSDVRDQSLLAKVWSVMQAAEEELGKVKAAQEKLSQEELKGILSNLGIESVEQVDSLDMLRRLVVAMGEQTATS